MKNYIFLVLTWLLSSGMTHTLFAQSNLEEVLHNLDKQLVAVTVGKEKTDPSVSSDKKSPCTVVFSIEETDAKGKTETSLYEISLSDLSSQLLKAMTKSGNVRLVEVSTKDHQEFIKFSKNGEFKGYVDKFNLPTFDNDAAKIVIDLLKSAIEVCEKTPSASCPKPLTFSDATNQLKTLLSKIVINELQIEQELVFDKNVPTRAVYTTRELGKSKPTEHVHVFDFADLMDNKVLLKVADKQLKINVFSRNGDLIQRLENGKCQSNSDDFAFLATSIEQAKCLVKTLQATINLARDEAEKRLPVLTDLDAALKLAADNVKNFDQCGTAYEQSLDKKCLSTFSILTNTEGGKKSDKQTASFNFSDINTKASDIKINGNKIAVRLRINESKDYIKVVKNGILQNYESEVFIFTKTSEEAKLILHALKKIVELCPKTAVSTCDKKGASALDCALAAVKTVKQGDEDVKQRLERLPDNDFKLRLTMESLKGKNTEESNYEWNMKDIDSRRIELKINGKDVSVLLPTKNNEKIIKLNKKDKTEYLTKINIAVEDIESGRILVGILQKSLD
ncbi:MAG: hypothetical protein JNL70_13955 [Saprospiraceae bacterium]|nr:hypothetical protein [Saprospiraceae bacterium]